MPRFFEKQEWGLTFDRKNTSLRARLIDVFLLIFLVIGIIIISITLIEYPPFDPTLEKDITALYIGTSFILVSVGVIYVLKRWISVDAASILLLLFLLIAITISDTPIEVTEGRTLIVFSLPIVIASVLYRPWGSFIFAGLCSLIVIFLEVNYVHGDINIIAFIVFFLLALAAWLYARGRDNAVYSLYQSVKKIEEANEEIQNLAKFPKENPNSIMRVSPDGKLVYANPASQSIIDHWHCRPGEPIPQKYQEIVMQCLQEQHQQEIQIEVKGRVFSLVFAPIIDANYVNIYGGDETERVRGEKALRESEQRYRQLFDTMQDGFSLHEIICDEQGKPVDYRFLEVNAAFEKLTGVPAEKIIGKTVLEIFPNTEREWIDNYGKVALTGKSIRFENYAQAIGKYFEVVAYSPRENQFAVLSKDITERKNTEKELEKSRERERTLADILEHASQPFATGYPDGRITAINAAFCELVGYSLEELQNMSWIEDITPPEWRQFEQDQLSIAETTGQSIRYEKELQRKDGSKVPVELLVHLVEDEQGKQDYYYAFVTDLTERKKVEQEIRMLNLELEQRVIDRTKQLDNTLSELESFAYSVSHDLRAPLRTIDGFSQALESEYSRELQGDGLHYLERVRSGVKRMDQLIADLLKLSRVTRQEINYEQADLSKIAREIRDELQHNQPDRMVVWDIQEGIKAFGDVHLLKVAVGNLLQNAWKFTGTTENASIQFGCMDNDGQNIYYVRDNGVGFDMKYADKLFGAFQRLHSVKVFPGSGIGLATVQRIIHRHGGKIWAESAVNQGAVFYFMLDERNIDGVNESTG
ncbi:MAG: PAS domain S-box protein [Anaerolineales bacterium]|nr:PAS domain S-box protein [Anaerolineales bacterium]